MPNLRTKFLTVPLCSIGIEGSLGIGAGQQLIENGVRNTGTQRALSRQPSRCHTVPWSMFCYVGTVVLR
jgi:hypothetical protein